MFYINILICLLNLYAYIYINLKGNCLHRLGKEGIRTLFIFILYTYDYVNFSINYKKF